MSYLRRNQAPVQPQQTKVKKAFALLPEKVLLRLLELLTLQDCLRLRRASHWHNCALPHLIPHAHPLLYRLRLQHDFLKLVTAIRPSCEDGQSKQLDAVQTQLSQLFSVLTSHQSFKIEEADAVSRSQRRKAEEIEEKERLLREQRIREAEERRLAEEKRQFEEQRAEEQRRAAEKAAKLLSKSKSPKSVTFNEDTNDSSPTPTTRDENSGGSGALKVESFDANDYAKQLIRERSRAKTTGGITDGGESSAGELISPAKRAEIKKQLLGVFGKKASSKKSKSLKGKKKAEGDESLETEGEQKIKKKKSKSEKGSSSTLGRKKVKPVEGKIGALGASLNFNPKMLSPEELEKKSGGGDEGEGGGDAGGDAGAAEDGAGGAARSAGSKEGGAASSSPRASESKAPPPVQLEDDEFAPPPEYWPAPVKGKGGEMASPVESDSIASYLKDDDFSSDDDDAAYAPKPRMDLSPLPVAEASAPLFDGKKPDGPLMGNNYAYKQFQSSSYKDVKSWEPVYKVMHGCLRKQKQQYVMPLLLTLYMDYSEFLHGGLGEAELAFKALQHVCCSYTKAMTGYRPMPMQKVVMRYLHRKLIEWGRALGKTKSKDYHPLALKDRDTYAALHTAESSGRHRAVAAISADASDTEVTPTAQWNPPPKGNINKDFLDCFIAADQDSATFRASDPLFLFFKLRYACILALEKQFQPAIEKLNKAVDLASNAKAAEEVDSPDLDQVLKMCAARSAEFSSKE